LGAVPLGSSEAASTAFFGFSAADGVSACAAGLSPSALSAGAWSAVLAGAAAAAAAPALAAPGVAAFAAVIAAIAA
jgi:hypothetical protein